MSVGHVLNQGRRRTALLGTMLLYLEIVAKNAQFLIRIQLFDGTHSLTV